MFVYYVGSGLCDELITRSEESYPVCVCVCVCLCDIVTSTVRVSEMGRWATGEKKKNC